MAEWLIYFNAEWVTETTDAGWRQRSQDVRALREEMKSAGVYVFLGGLDLGAPAFHVKPGDEAPLITDGPYIETKELIGGFTVIDVPDAAAAHHWAGRIAMACGWPQEVRLFQTPTHTPTPDADRAEPADED
jgi:hypothetical protein